MRAILQDMTAVVLAGGLGTRIQHLAPGVPKPMIAVSGRPFLDWVARYLRLQGIQRTIVSTGHLGEVVERHFTTHPIKEMSIRCVREGSALGTAGGFMNAAGASHEEPSGWLVLNGDSLVLADLGPAAAMLSEPAAQGVIVGVSVPDASRYGRVTADSSMRLLRFDEKLPGAGVINAGVYLFKPSVLARFPAKRPLSFENDVFPQLLADGLQLKVCVTHAPFLDIGTPESLAQAGAFIEQNLQALEAA